ncbi:MAG: hypothetical protein H0U65_03190 [Rubrobacter sp.]|nr:hypothetical protein [Rubrobacter sp.]
MQELRDALFEIVEEHAPGTVRGFFYLATTRGIVPKTENEGYRPVQRELVKMRREGLIPWGWITDGSRVVYGHHRYNSLSSYAGQVAGNYRKDYWFDAPKRVEMWLEKEALRGVISPVVVGEFGLNLHVTKGQPSITYLYEAAEEIIDDGRPAHIYVLTDFDPGGLRIFDRIHRELDEFLGFGIASLEVERIAVTPEQIAEHGLPTRPGKQTDPQAAKFEREHGEGCVELDAMPPDLLRELVGSCLESHMDASQLHALKLAEEEEREGLRQIEELLGGIS